MCIRDSAEATGRGVAFIADQAARQYWSDRTDLQVIVQGMGNVGGIAARTMAEYGYKVIAVSDVSGGYYNPDGLDIPDMLQYIQNSANRSLEGYTHSGCQAVSGEDILTYQCDILLPCACLLYTSDVYKRQP